MLKGELDMRTYKKIGIIFGMTVLMGIFSVFSGGESGGIQGVHGETVHTVTGAAAGEEEEVRHWRFSDGCEENIIELDTRVPRDNSMTYYEEKTVERQKSEELLQVPDVTIYVTEQTWIPIPTPRPTMVPVGKTKRLDWNYHESKKTTKQSDTKILDYKIEYNGNSILVEKGENEKLYYACAAPSVGEGNLDWRLLEDTITVPVQTTYQYTRIDYIPRNEYAVLYEPWEYGKNFNNRYADKLTPYCKIDVDFYLGWGTNVYFKNIFVYPQEETITYTDEIEFYRIDTSFISQEEKDKNVYIKSSKKTKPVVEKYRFKKEKNQKFKVKYTVKDGFLITGVSSGRIWTGWINGGLDKVYDYCSDDSYLMWRTQDMNGWSMTTLSRVNKDIPVESLQENGATVYFMDAGAMNNMVKVKIPAIDKPPKVSLNVKDLDYTIEKLQKNKQQIRVWSYDEDGKIAYWNKLEERIGVTKAEDNWYDYTDGSKSLDLMKLTGVTENKNKNGMPAFYIEIRDKETKKKKASAIRTFFVNAQEIFSLQKDATITLEKGRIKVSNAQKNMSYEYFVEGVSKKWGDISKNVISDKNIVEGSKILIRKKSVKTSDGTTLLPSTYVVLDFDKEGKVYTADDIVNLS